MVLAAALSLVPVLLGATGLDISAEVDRTTVAMGERLLLTVTATGPNVSGLPQPTLPRLADFTNHGSMWGRFTSDSGGRDESRQLTVGFVYTLEPKRTGTLTIGPVSLTHQGTTYQTQPIAVRVVAAGESVPPLARWTDANGIVLSCSVDRSSVYVGEQVLVTYRLFARTRVGGLMMKDAPGFTGFWAARLDDARDLSWFPTTCNSQPCSAAVIRQAALFPTQPGTLTLDKMTLSGIVAVSSGLFKGMPAPFTVSSVPLSVTAKPLPDAGRPADFGGGVGSFALTAGLSADKSDNGEPLKLQVKVSGTGNIGTIGVPLVSVADGVSLLGPDVHLQTSDDGGRVGGTRAFDYSVIPRANGLNVVPAISMSFFNPKSDSYYTLATQRIEFVATGVTGSRLAGEPEPRIGPPGTDILHIKPSCTRLASAAANPWWSLLFYPFGIAVFLVGAVAGRHRRRLEADRGYALRSRAGRLLAKRLRESARLLAAGDELGFYAALDRAVTGYAGDRFNVEVTGMTGDELRTALSRRGVDAAVVGRLLDFSSRGDVARFSPGAASLSPEEALVLARGIIRDL
ncbi:MAG: BatD family protein [candidate division WOR-3 bacterium]|nr:BatD family protein [candidate division WOR-3 bacterium]